MRRMQLDKIVNESGGSQLPDDDKMDQHLNDLLDELAALIDQIKFIKKTDGLVAQAHFLPGHIEITFNATLSHQAKKHSIRAASTSTTARMPLTSIPTVAWTIGRQPRTYIMIPYCWTCWFI